MTKNKQIILTRLPDEKERLEPQIEGTDRQLDALVYELYGLTGEEIKIVEGSYHSQFLRNWEELPAG